MAGAQLSQFLGAPLPRILDDPVSVSMATDSGGRFLELDAGFNCPVCKEPLRDYGIRADPELRLATCSRCEGVFLEATQLKRLQRLAPRIAAAKKRDLSKPLSANPASLRESLAEASDAEKAAVVRNTLEQLERKRRGQILSPLGCLAVASILITLAVGAVVVYAAVLADRFASAHF